MKQIILYAPSFYSKNGLDQKILVSVPSGAIGTPATAPDDKNLAAICNVGLMGGGGRTVTKLADKDGNVIETGGKGALSSIFLSTVAGVAGDGPSHDLSANRIHQIVDAAKYANGQMIFEFYGHFNWRIFQSVNANNPTSPNRTTPVQQAELAERSGGVVGITFPFRVYESA